jgi:uncharacterized protein (TIGR02453 family)
MAMVSTIGQAAHSRARSDPAARPPGFEGFPEETLRFLDDLGSNNNKAWFDAHRAEYERYLLEPAKELVIDLGQVLQTRVSAGIHAEPRINGSILRINRDIRFSKDKSPYKTWLGLWFWEGEGRSSECPGFWFSLSARELTLGAGMHQFSEPLLARFRSAVLDSASGPALVEALAAVQRAGPSELGGSHYQKVPRGFDPNHERAEYLRHTGIHVGRTLPIPEELSSPAFVEFCLRHYQDFAPLQRWSVAMMAD